MWRTCVHPWRSKFFHFYAVFGKMFANKSQFGSWRPFPSGKSWICHCKLNKRNCSILVIVTFIIFFVKWAHIHRTYVLIEPMYTFLREMDCLVNNDLHAMDRNDGSCFGCLPEKCVKWCNNHRHCGAFVVTPEGRCHFKNYSCWDNAQRPNTYDLRNIWFKIGDSQFENS